MRFIRSAANDDSVIVPEFTTHRGTAVGAGNVYHLGKRLETGTDLLLLVLGVGTDLAKELCPERK